ncbi:hypothetical protein OC835_007629 [Tilletia horrida]|nr:hypothetical protein OC835_007629 [Tilletia horrida]KAK0544282.1 hypothetical protein OC844_007483 [Tilletia horrida]
MSPKKASKQIRQTARKSTGGTAPRLKPATVEARQTGPRPAKSSSAKLQGVKGSHYSEETGEPELIADWADTAVPVWYFSKQPLAKKDLTAGQAAAAAASL